MTRLSDANVVVAREIIGRLPRKKSAMIPLLHLAQEQDGHVTEDAMQHIAELLEVTSAEVLGVASFYEMFKFEQIGTYCINVCIGISCHLTGAWELIEHAEHVLGIKDGSTTDDGMFTVEAVECIAACTESPALSVNYRYRHRVTPDRLEALIADLRAGTLSDEIPSHGTLARVRQRTPANWTGNGKAAQEKVDAL
jgi:NADH-quinone oxidoreductase subunit E